MRATDKTGQTTEVMDKDSTEDLQRVLREIYDNFLPVGPIVSTPNRKKQPVIINTSTRKKAGTNAILIYMAKIPTEIVKNKHLHQTPEHKL